MTFIRERKKDKGISRISEDVKLSNIEPDQGEQSVAKGCFSFEIVKKYHVKCRTMLKGQC